MTETNREPRINKRGNRVTSSFINEEGEMNRYYFDSVICKSKDGWKQFDTDQDASYFGVWVNLKERKTITYAEGDLIVVECTDDEHLKAELEDMEEFYGSPPPAIKYISFKDNTITEYFDERPKVKETL